MIHSGRLQLTIDSQNQQLETLRQKIMSLERALTEERSCYRLVHEAGWEYLLDKGELLTSKMKIDLSQLASSPQYHSFRLYHLKVASTLYERASNEDDPAAVHLLCQVAKYVKSLVAEMDRMKSLSPEEQVDEGPWLP